MKFSKTNSSSFRYFLAGLKPLGKVTFWGPLTVLGLLGLAVWQYTANPEWLSRIGEQPQTMEDALAESEYNRSTIPQTATPQLNQPLNLENLQRNQGLNNPNGLNPSSPSQPLQTSNQPNLNQSNLNNSQKPSVVQPLVPEANLNRNPIQSSPIQPVRPAPLQIENHLQKAINQQSQGASNLNRYNPNPSNSGVNSGVNSGTLPELNINNRSLGSNLGASNSSPSLPQNNYQNNYPNNYPNNYQNNYSSQPVQPSPQPYQVPYNNYNYSVQPQSPVQPIQPPASSFQVPYNNYQTQSPTNNFSGQGQSNQTGQGNTVPYNSYSRPIPQIQPSIRESTSY